MAVITFSAATGDSHVEIRPTLWIGASVVAAAIAVAVLGAAGYMAFRDDILEAAWSRQSRMEQAYEDRIAGLRAEIDRINSRQLLDQDAFEAKIDKLIARQDELRGQEARVLGLVDKARLSGMPVPAEPEAAPASEVRSPVITSPSITTTAPMQPSTVPPTPHPLDDMPLRSSGLEQPAPAGHWALLPASERKIGNPGARIAAVEAALDRMAMTHAETIAKVTGMAEKKSRVIEAVVGKLGLRFASNEPPVPKPRPVIAADAVGGPLVPIGDASETLARAEAAISRLTQLKHSVGLLPLGQPVRGAAEVTSTFGERMDPFLGVLAMHTGIDFRASMGQPVVATGAGVVTDASRQGGYGNMVEIDHGNGLVTRYGHLSQFAVSIGQKVKAGQVIAYAGSTGRSTAPHVHYETRVSGEAVNPTSYLEAGNRLRPLLN